jgi:signal transduction histidine kinase
MAREWRAETALVASAAACACLGVFAEVRYATVAVPWRPGGYLLAAAAAAPLLARRRRPVLAAALCLLAVMGYHFAGYPGLAPAVLVFGVCHALGAYAGRYGVLYGLVPAALVWAVLTIPPHPLPWSALDLSMPSASMAASAVVGASARRQRLEREAREREQAAAARDRLGRQLVEERLRLARELHDVLAHTLSVVSVQSAAALDALGHPGVGDPDLSAARDAVSLVRRAAREAMPQLRAALEVLRSDGAPSDAAPQPGLGELLQLAAQSRDAGLEVDLVQPAETDTLPAHVQLAAYRIVQEALTNTLRHACARRAAVTLTRGDGQLVVEITDDGHGSAPRAPGLGLRGMRERAEALGGRLEAGPGPVGGFLVRAELPCEST